MEERVKRIISEQLGRKIEDVTSEKNLHDDLNADSLDLIELTMALEEEFGIDIPDEDAEKLLTVGGVIKYIEEHAKENA